MTGRLAPAATDRPPTTLSEDALVPLFGAATPGRYRQTARMARVVRLRYGTNPIPSLRDVAQCLGVTAERVRQIEAMAIRVLAHPSLWDAAIAAAGRETRLGAAILDQRRRAIEELAWRDRPEDDDADR